MELTITIPDVYWETEENIDLRVKLKDGILQGVSYISMNGRCEEELEVQKTLYGNELNF